MVTSDDLSDVGTVQAVLESLGDPDGEHYSSDVIDRKLIEARVIVASRAADGATDDDLEAAVVSVAAYKTASVQPPAEQKKAAGVSKSYDVAAYLDALLSDRDDALREIAPPEFGFKAF